MDFRCRTVVPAIPQDARKQTIGGTFDWTRVSQGNRRAFANRQMDAARVPQPPRDLYWQSYDAMMGRLRDDGR